MADMTMNFPALRDFAWEIRDENQYRFLEQKYQNRQKLSEEAETARKLADKSETIDGKPNPHYPRLRMEADMAQMRFDMAYIVERNTHLGKYIESLEYLFQRVGILEGAYGHVKMLAENCRIDYAMIAEALKFFQKLKKEHHDDKQKPATAG